MAADVTKRVGKRAEYIRRVAFKRRDLLQGGDCLFDAARNLRDERVEPKCLTIAVDRRAKEKEGVPCLSIPARLMKAQRPLKLRQDRRRSHPAFGYCGSRSTRKPGL